MTKTEKHRYVWWCIAAAATAILLAACAEDASSTRSVASATPPVTIGSETVVEEPSAPADSLPDPADIDVAYMQQVADQFARREGEVLRKLAEDREYTPELDTMIAEFTGGTYRRLTRNGLQAVVEDGTYDERYEPSPGDPTWTVVSVDATNYPCVSAYGLVDVTPTRLGGPYPQRPTLWAWKVGADFDHGSWKLVDVALPRSDEDDISRINLCTAS